MRAEKFGILGLETVGGVGANAKMNEFFAVMGICNLRHVKEEIAKRKMWLNDAESIWTRPITRLGEFSYATSRNRKRCYD